MSVPTRSIQPLRLVIRPAGACRIRRRRRGRRDGLQERLLPEHLASDGIEGGRDLRAQVALASSELSELKQMLRAMLRRRDLDTRTLLACYRYLAQIDAQQRHLGMIAALI